LAETSPSSGSATDLPGRLDRGVLWRLVHSFSDEVLDAELR
jgi:hypothetical protein